MPRLGDPRKQQQWLQHLQRWQRSPLSARDYCQRHQLSEASFYFWKRTLRRRGLLTDTPAGHKPLAAKAALFVPVAVQQAKASTGHIDLVTPDGWTVRLAAGFDVDSLRQLLAVLRERPC
jgi:sarcosine oxidase gamma subunit